MEETGGENGNLARDPEEAGTRDRVREIAQGIKSRALLLWEAATGAYQVYSIISSGAFEDAWSSRVLELVNVTVNGSTTVETVFTGLEVESDLFYIPRYPENALVNVTVYTIAVTLLLLLSLLHGIELLRSVFTSCVMVILALAVVAIYPGLSMVWGFLSLSDIDRGFLLFVFAFFAAVMGYCFWKVRKVSPASREQVRVEYVSIVVLFQAYDVVKDVFFLATSTNDPLFFLLTIFDIQLSWLMLLEIYAELDFDLPPRTFLKAIVQSLFLACALIFAPSFSIWIAGLAYIAFAQQGLNNARDNKPPPCESCCALLRIQDPQICCLSVLVAEQRQKEARDQQDPQGGVGATVLDTNGQNVPQRAQQGLTAHTGCVVKAKQPYWQKRAKKIKTASVIVWEAATSFYQIYVLINTGEFDEFYYSSVTSGNETTPFVDTELYYWPTYPGTTMINVAVYTLAASSLVLFSLLYFCNVNFTYFAVLVIISLGGATVVVFPILPYMNSLPTSPVAISLFSIGGILCTGALVYVRPKLQRFAVSIKETYQIQYVSVLVFFQLYDVAKDIFFIVVTPDDPFVLILTVFDIALSLLMIVEFYAEDELQIPSHDYAACLFHYAAVVTVIVLLPGVYMFSLVVALSLVLEILSRRYIESANLSDDNARYSCLARTTYYTTAFFSILVANKLKRMES